jgi:Holliday junction resolvasome RuvABC endonuclease subunit
MVLADLLHAAHDKGLDFADALRLACTHFRDETAPEA